jgi:MoaA/NifB/PqqE/SkfB family radical SAM enzyme
MEQYPDSSRFKFWREPYNIVLDTTTYCNAKCPQCHRINSTKDAKLSFQGKITKDLPLLHVPFEKIKNTFTPNVLNKINNIQLCPTWGDHMMHPYASEMVEYFLKSNRYINVSINTNGSMRDELYWWKMCALGVKHKSKYNHRRLDIMFAIDGINQEMHSLYRRNTDLHKVLNHMKIASEFKDHVKVRSQTVLFKHNQDHLDEIETLCKKYGSENHTSVISERFNDSQSENNKYYYFYDENNQKLTLEKVTPEWRLNFKKEGALVSRQKKADATEKPTCGWSLTNALQINFNGNVWPCCYFGNSDIMRRQEWKEHHEFIKKYYDYNNNIYETSIEDILNNEWWQELPYMLESDNLVRQCKRHCTNCIGDNQLRLAKRL